MVFVARTAGKPPVKLTPLELAVGEELTKTRKRRRELIDMSYHRSAYLLIIVFVIEGSFVVNTIDFSRQPGFHCYQDLQGGRKSEASFF